MAKNRIALITGITGQDGSYLAEFLLDKGYQVHGIVRRASSFNTGRIDHIYQDPHERDRVLHLHYGDLTDGSNISRIIEKIEPDEVYNLGAQSHVKVSFEVPEYTADVDAFGTGRLIPSLQPGDQRRFVVILIYLFRCSYLHEVTTLQSNRQLHFSLRAENGQIGALPEHRRIFGTV